MTNRVLAGTRLAWKMEPPHEAHQQRSVLGEVDVNRFRTLFRAASPFLLLINKAKASNQVSSRYLRFVISTLEIMFFLSREAVGNYFCLSKCRYVSMGGAELLTLSLHNLVF
jgi:hypothetical protein